MNLVPPLKKTPFILKPMEWLHKRHYGQVLSPILWWGRLPFVFYLVSMFVGYLERRSSSLDPVLRALVSARVAQLCVCEFCVDITHMKIMQKNDHVDRLMELPQWRTSTLFSATEKLVLTYAEAVTMTPPNVDDALKIALRENFSDNTLTELTALIGLQNLSARFNSAMSIPPQGLCQVPVKSKETVVED